MIKFILKHFWHNFVDGVKKLHAVIVKNCLTKGNNHLYVYATIISPKSKNLIDYIILKGLPLYSMAQFHFEPCPIKTGKNRKPYWRIFNLYFTRNSHKKIFKWWTNQSNWMLPPFKLQKLMNQDWNHNMSMNPYVSDQHG